MIPMSGCVGRGYPIVSAYAPLYVPAPTPSPGPLGLYLNGVTTTRFAAALAGVKNGTADLIAVDEGDSTRLGVGTGDDNNGTAPYNNGWKYRPAKVRASLFTAAGYPSADRGMIGTGAFTGGLTNYVGNIVWNYNGATLIHFAYPGTWGLTSSQPYGEPGGVAPIMTSEVLYNYENSMDGAEIIVANTGNGVVSYNGIPDTTITQSTGFTRMTSAPGGTPGDYRPGLSLSSGSGVKLVSYMPLNRTVKRVVWYVNAAQGAASVDMAATNASGTGARDINAFLNPDLFIINLGLNDARLSVSVSDYIAAMVSIIAPRVAAGATVLWVFPPPTSSSLFASIGTYHTAAKAKAAELGVAFLSLREHWGSDPANLPAGFYRDDGGPHPTVAGVQVIAGVEFDALKAIVPAAFA